MKLEFCEIERIEAALEPFDWAFRRDHADEIERYWADFTKDRAGIFNGTVLIQHRGGIENGVFRAGYSTTDYKTFLGYIRLPYPEPQMRNGFGMAALKSRDGAFLLGEMMPGTTNAGQIYFAAGTPDMGDVKDGVVDIEGSLLREMCEETGLTLADVRMGARMTCILLEKRVAFLRDVTIDLDATDARALMLERMKSLPEQELADIVIVRPDAPLDSARMPPFMAGYLAREFARR